MIQSAVRMTTTPGLNGSHSSDLRGQGYANGHTITSSHMAHVQSASNNMAPSYDRVN